MLTLLLSGLTCTMMVTSVLFFPVIKIKQHTFGVYWMIALGGALALLLTGQPTAETLWQDLTASRAVNPIEILILFLSMTFLSVYLDEVGFFRLAASRVLEKAGTSQLRLFLLLYATVAVLTVFTSNDIIVLTFTPFICYFAKAADIDPVPYLVAEFVAANTWSMALIIGNPTNIYLASAFQIDFFAYLRVMLLPAVASGTTALLVLWLLFRRKLKRPMRAGAEHIAVENRTALKVGLSMLACCTVLLAFSSYVSLPMWGVAFAFALGLALFALAHGFYTRCGAKELLAALKRVPWELIPFVLSMFTIVLALNEQGFTGFLCNLLGGRHTIWKYGFASLLSANVMNNIPMSVLFCSVMKPLGGSTLTGALYACVAGSNIGAFLTPVGALAGIMWTSILKDLKVDYSFRDFVRYGVLTAVPAMLAALGCIALLV